MARDNINQGIDNNILTNIPFMTEEHEKRVELEYFEDEFVKYHNLNRLKTLLKNEGIRYLDEDVFLLTFLRARDLDVERAFRSLKSLYKAKSFYKELFSEVDPTEVFSLFSEISMGFLPYRDEEGSCLLYMKLENWNPARNSLGHILRAITCAVLHISRNLTNPYAGIKIIVDAKGFTLSNLSHVSIRYIKLLVEGFRSAVPARFRGIYAINENSLITYGWFLVKQFLTKKLRNRFHFFGKDIQEFHKHIPPKFLPKQLEGDLPPYNNTEWIQQLSSQSTEYLLRILHS